MALDEFENITRALKSVKISTREVWSTRTTYHVSSTSTVLLRGQQTHKPSELSLDEIKSIVNKLTETQIRFIAYIVEETKVIKDQVDDRYFI
jgi:hypothetical protein